MENTLIVDGGWAGRLLQLTLPRSTEVGVNLVGFVDSDPKERRDHPERIAALVQLFDVDRVILASPGEAGDETTHVARVLRELGKRVDIVEHADGVPVPAHAHDDQRTLTIGLPRATISLPSRIGKRAIDVVGALIGLFVASPLFAYTAWRIKSESPGPVFARRRCLGMGMNEFMALDFRTTQPRAAEPSHRAYLKQTMRARSADDPSAGIDRDPDDGVTPVGRRLRDTGLAELPRLINVLRGEMSLVGPRPCDVHERDVFEPRHFERFLVPAGLTGPLQSAPKGQIPYTASLEMEVAYARTRSLKGDAGLLLRMVLGRIRPVAPA